MGNVLYYFSCTMRNFYLFEIVYECFVCVLSVLSCIYFTLKPIEGIENLPCQRIMNWSIILVDDVYYVVEVEWVGIKRKLDVVQNDADQLEDDCDMQEV